MRITPPQTKPPVPQISPGQTSIKVPYIGPAEKEELIGRIPEDHYVSTDTFSYSSQLIANPAKAVYANQPQMDSAGKTVFEKKTKEVKVFRFESRVVDRFAEQNWKSRGWNFSLHPGV